MGYTNVRVFTIGLVGWEKSGRPSAPGATMRRKKEEGLYELTVTSIVGNEVKLADYKGKVLLIVNVASRCDLTPQYKELQELYKKYEEKGLAVLGFPANEFGGQEPGTDAEIREFCTKEYGVTFPLFAKIVVRGEGQHPLYAWLTGGKEFGGEIQWNFTKFLVDRDGRVVARWEPEVRVSEEWVTRAIERELERGQK